MSSDFIGNPSVRACGGTSEFRTAVCKSPSPLWDGAVFLPLAMAVAPRRCVHREFAGAVLRGLWKEAEPHCRASLHQTRAPLCDRRLGGGRGQLVWPSLSWSANRER